MGVERKHLVKPTYFKQNNIQIAHSSRTSCLLYERYTCKLDACNFNIAVLWTPLLGLYLSSMWKGVDLGTDTKNTYEIHAKNILTIKNSRFHIRRGRGGESIRVLDENKIFTLIMEKPFKRAPKMIKHWLHTKFGFASTLVLIAHPHLLVWATSKWWVTTLVATSGSHWLKHS